MHRKSLLLIVVGTVRIPLTKDWHVNYNSSMILCEKNKSLLLLLLLRVVIFSIV